MSRSDAGGSRADGARPIVVHLDHTSTAGGAEYALARMLSAAPEWNAVVLLPPGDGSAFGSYSPVIHGVRQPAGVSSGRVGVVVAGAARLVLQSVSTRVHPRFRAADIVDANTARSAAYGALAALTSRKAFAVHLRDVVHPESLGGFGHTVMTKLVLPRADGVIANSQTTLASAAPFLRPGALTSVIPSASGFQLGRVRPSRAQGAPLRIGMLARIDPWKGQALLLDAFAQAVGDTDAMLEFAGAPLFGHEEYLDELRSRARELGLEQRVRFLGQVKDVTGLLDTWDVAVQYSTRPEPLGQNVLQYLAAGCTVLAADEGGPAEWIEDDINGLRVSPRDVAALAEAVRRVAVDPRLRERLAGAAAKTPGLMEDIAVTRAHARFYAELLER